MKKSIPMMANVVLLCCFFKDAIRFVESDTRYITDAYHCYLYNGCVSCAEA